MSFFDLLEKFEYRRYNENKKGMHGAIVLTNHPIFTDAVIVIDGKVEDSILDCKVDFIDNEQCAARMFDKHIDSIIKEVVSILINEGKVINFSSINRSLVFVFDMWQEYEGKNYNCSIYVTETIGGSRRKIHHIMIAEETLCDDLSANMKKNIKFGINQDKQFQYAVNYESYVI